MASSSGSWGGEAKATTPQHELASDPLLEPGSFIEDEPESVPKKEKAESAVSDATPETPSWLPDGWKMIFKVRGSGATAGTIDRYYFEPNSERRFRSRKEVEYFLQTGTKRKKSDADVKPSESPASEKKKSRSGSKNGCPTPSSSLKFDFENVPEMISWKLKDASSDHWVPFIDDKLVPKSMKQEWDAALQSLSSIPSGNM